VVREVQVWVGMQPVEGHGQAPPAPPVHAGRVLTIKC
jgi:hypothetical protein